VTTTYIQGNDLDGTFEYERLLNEVGEEWNDQFHPNPVPAAHLMLHLLDTLTRDQ
jgi:hypothetical protein